jgi:hypothetical protein
VRQCGLRYVWLRRLLPMSINANHQPAAPAGVRGSNRAAPQARVDGLEPNQMLIPTAVRQAIFLKDRATRSPTWKPAVGNSVNRGRCAIVNTDRGAVAHFALRDDHIASDKSAPWPHTTRVSGAYFTALQGGTKIAKSLKRTLAATWQKAYSIGVSLNSRG